MEDKKDEYMCPSCGEMRDVEEMCNDNGACDWCNLDNYCPKCHSSAIGIAHQVCECFSCGHSWEF